MENRPVIQIEIRVVYGNEKAYPLCMNASAFARIAGTKVLTRKVLKEIANLGYDIAVNTIGSSIRYQYPYSKDVSTFYNGD